MIESVKFPEFFVNIPVELSDSTSIVPPFLFVKLIFLPAPLDDPNIPTEFLEVEVNFIFPEFSATASSLANIPVDFLPASSIFPALAFSTLVPSSEPYIPIIPSTKLEPLISLLFVTLPLAVASIPVPSLPFILIIPSFTPSETFPVAVFFPVT